MSCGCRGGGGQPAQRQVRNIVKPPGEGILRAVTTSHNMPAHNPNPILTDEKRKVEKLRRDAILRALGRP